MSSGERPMGAAKGKQTTTMALCQPPPSPLCTLCGRPLPLKRSFCGRRTVVPLHVSCRNARRRGGGGVEYITAVN